jgi:hypothetical protein
VWTHYFESSVQLKWIHYFESSVQLKKLPLVPGDFWQILCAFSLLILSMFSLLSDQFFDDKK